MYATIPSLGAGRAIWFWLKHLDKRQVFLLGIVSFRYGDSWNQITIRGLIDMRSFVCFFVGSFFKEKNLILLSTTVVTRSYA